MPRDTRLRPLRVLSSLSNNGKIAAQTDAISGEQIVYTYDALNRLATAVTSDNPSVTQWGQSYTYDGFGNLLDQTVIKGSAPSLSTTYDPTTNRQTGETADANGNIGSGNVYDIENRLVQPYSSTARYAHDTNNKRVWRGDSSVSLDEIDFWSHGGLKLAAYQVSVSGSTIQFALTSSNVYFGGNLISKGAPGGSYTDHVTLTAVVADRLGSIGKFYPFGQEKPSATTNDTEKFTGYFRDAATGLDYADQRYHEPGMGRFRTPDPYQGSAVQGVPGSWNRYAYVGGDPVNRIDLSGLDDDPSDEYGDWAPDRYAGAQIADGSPDDAVVPDDGPCTGGGTDACFTAAVSASSPGFWGSVSNFIGAVGSAVVNGITALPQAFSAGAASLFLNNDPMGGVQMVASSAVVGGPAAEAAVGATIIAPSLLQTGQQGNFNFGASSQFVVQLTAGRVSGDVGVLGQSQTVGSYFSTETVQSGSQATSMFSLSPTFNTATWYSPSNTIPSGAFAIFGTASPQFGQPGGGFQIYVAQPTNVTYDTPIHLVP